MKKIFFVLFLLLISYEFYFKYTLSSYTSLNNNYFQETIQDQTNEKKLEKHTDHKEHKVFQPEITQFYSGEQVQGEGTVIRILSDDLQGSRHQRFIIQLSSGRTLLVAHNIDLAPRLNRLSIGDTVTFNGVYEWNAKGGVIHWTHHDPRGRHQSGWLKHQGRTYQ